MTPPEGPRFEPATGIEAGPTAPVGIGSTGGDNLDGEAGLPSQSPPPDTDESIPGQPDGTAGERVERDEQVKRDGQSERDEQADTLRRPVEEILEVLELAAAVLDGTGEPDPSDSAGKARTAEEDHEPGAGDDADERGPVDDIAAGAAPPATAAASGQAPGTDLAREQVHAHQAPHRSTHPVTAPERAERGASPHSAPVPGPPPSPPYAERPGVDEPAPAPSRARWHDALVPVVVGLLVAIATFDVIMWLDRREDIEDSLSASQAAAQPTPPVGAPHQGVYTEVTVLRSGDLEVQQWLRSRTFFTDLSLQAPSDPFLADEVRASGLRVSADGLNVDGPTEVGSSPVALTFAWSQVVHLTYRLSGVLVRSESQPYQALARVTSLDLDYGTGEKPIVTRLRGAGVLSVLCAGEIANQPPQPCGRRVAGGWEVWEEDPGSSYRVMAQLDLSQSE